jgi:hypothetical protein
MMITSWESQMIRVPNSGTQMALQANALPTHQPVLRWILRGCWVGSDW